MTTVVCHQCKTEHPALFRNDPTMAMGCSSEVKGNLIIGSYGSAVADMTVFRFTKDPPPEGSVICDACIVAGLKSGLIERDTGGRLLQGDEDERD